MGIRFQRSVGLDSRARRIPVGQRETKGADLTESRIGPDPPVVTVDDAAADC